MGKIIFNKMVVENGEVKPSLVKEIDSSKLTSECWNIQFLGLDACTKCDLLNTKDCGGKKIRKRLLKKK